jgi:hypothetical protein
MRTAHRLLPGEAFRSFMGEGGRAFACDARIQGVVPATRPYLHVGASGDAAPLRPRRAMAAHAGVPGASGQR